MRGRLSAPGGSGPDSRVAWAFVDGPSSQDQKAGNQSDQQGIRGGHILIRPAGIRLDVVKQQDRLTRFKREHPAARPTMLLMRPHRLKRLPAPGTGNSPRTRLNAFSDGIQHQTERRAHRPTTSPRATSAGPLGSTVPCSTSARYPSGRPSGAAGNPVNNPIAVSVSRTALFLEPSCNTA